MNAAFLDKFRMPLVIRDIDEPLIGENEVLVKIEACDLSRGTFELIMGSVDVRPPKLPIIPGTGASGKIERTGSQVQKVRPGDHVLIHGMIHCGQCGYCLQRRDNLCSHAQYLGKTVNGILAEFIKVPDANVLPVSADLSFPESAVISGSLATSYHAVEEAKIEPGHSVAIYGSGCLGLGALELILQENIKAIAIDIDGERLKLAKELGASETVNSKEEKPSSAVLKLTGMEGVDRALVMVGDVQAIQEALLSVRPGGKVVLAGYTSKAFSAKPIQFIRQEISLAGIRQAPIHLTAQLIQLVVKKRIRLSRLISHVFNPLSAVNEGVEVLRKENPLKVIIKPW